MVHSEKNFQKADLLELVNSGLTIQNMYMSSNCGYDLKFLLYYRYKVE